MASFGAVRVFIATSCVVLACAEKFLGANRLSVQEVEQQLYMELRSLMGRGDAASTERLDRLQSELRPLFSTLPKDKDNHLGQGAVRFALHRFFVLQHGWYVRGLQATGVDAGAGAGAAAAGVALEDRIPGLVLQTLEERHGGRTGLPELAVLAATLEDLIHSEAVEVLSSAYSAQNLSVANSMNRSSEKKIVDTYLLFHIMPNPKYAMLDTSRLNLLLQQVPKFYSGWIDTVMYVQDLRDAKEYDQKGQHNPFVAEAARLNDFNSIVGLVESLGEKFGQFQNLECRQMKNALLEISDGSGRVPLSKFYAAAFENRSSHFSESPEYLRHQGVLDESDPRQPKVVLANYVYGHGNCLACSSVYSICCLNECESLMSQVERTIAHPLAAPKAVVDVIVNMRSDTVSAPRNLSTLMRSRLDDIAGRHDGSIPLHGRLFAQWMHHAFPNECPYPHTSWSLEAPATPSEWLRAEQETGRKLKASKQEMQSFIEAASNSNATELPYESALPWTDEEEVMVGMESAGPKVLGWFRYVAWGLAASSAVGVLYNMLRTSWSQLRPGKACTPTLYGSRDYDKVFV